MGNLVCYRNSKAIVRIYEPIRLLPDVRLKPFLIPDAIKASRGQYYFVLESTRSYVANITFVSFTRDCVWGISLSAHSRFSSFFDSKVEWLCLLSSSELYAPDRQH